MRNELNWNPKAYTNKNKTSEDKEHLIKESMCWVGPEVQYASN